MNYFLLPIYFDYSSTTPLDPRVLEKIIPYFYYKFGNYSSRNHIFGWQIEYIVELSRKKISSFFNCDSRELIWTASSTESNNLAIKGLALFYKNKGNHILTLKTEHKSILECCNYLINIGYDVTFINIRKNGLIDLNSLKLYLKNSTILITLSFVNNEIGVVQNINFISNFCKNNKLFLHVDASQGNGKIYINLNLIKIDLMSISSHKIYGPKGIGALYIRRKSNIYLKILIHGGGHEKGLRSGTLPTSQIVGMAESYYILYKKFYFENLKIKNYKNIFLIEILKIDSVYLNGDLKYRIPHNINMSFDFIEGESLIITMKNIAISTGSACASKLLDSSYVLKVLNKSYNIIHGSIRITFGRFNTLTNLLYFINILYFSVKELRFITAL